MGVARQRPSEEEQEWRHTGQSQCQTPVNGDHDAERTHEEYDAVSDVVGHPGQEVADGIGVRSHPAHDVTDSGVIEVGEVQAVQLLVFIGHQAVDGVLAETFHEHLVSVPDRRTYRRHRDHRETQLGQTVMMTLNDDLVNDHAREQRHDHHQDLVDDEQHHHGGDPWKVWLAVWQYPAHVAGLLIGIGIDVHQGWTLAFLVALRYPVLSGIPRPFHEGTAGIIPETFPVEYVSSQHSMRVNIHFNRFGFRRVPTPCRQALQTSSRHSARREGTSKTGAQGCRTTVRQRNLWKKHDVWGNTMGRKDNGVRKRISPVEGTTGL
jgi:hypothetical protein